MPAVEVLKDPVLICQGTELCLGRGRFCWGLVGHDRADAQAPGHHEVEPCSYIKNELDTSPGGYQKGSPSHPVLWFIANKFVFYKRTLMHGLCHLLLIVSWDLLGASSSTPEEVRSSLYVVLEARMMRGEVEGP